MTAFGERKAWVFWALGLSLAFNLAFLAAFGYTEYRARCSCRMASGEAAGGGEQLSVDQQRALRESREKLDASLAPLRAQMAGHCRKLSEILATPEPSMVAIQAETAAMADIQRQVQDLILENFLKDRASLPKEKRGYFDGLLKERLCGANGCAMAASGKACDGAGENMSRETGPQGSKTK
jgi:hypothetical protein